MGRLQLGGGARAGCAVLAFVAAALARADSPVGQAAARDERGDLAWLQSVQEAARRRSFAGTIVYQRGDEVHASRVVQTFDGVESRERVLTLDGQQREYIRRGDEVQCLYPKQHRVVIERGGEMFPAFAQMLGADLLEHYELLREGSQRVAGSLCELAELRPRDRLRYGYRICVDPVSGLLFKAQTLNESGAVVEQVAFTDVTVGPSVDPAQVRPSWPTSGWAVERHQAQATAQPLEGWSITLPVGFRRLAEVSRRMTRGKESRQTFQAVYTDGLATVSVFIEPGVPADEPADGAQRRGPVTAFSRRVDDALVTVVGEVPPEAAASIAQSVTRAPTQP